MYRLQAQLNDRNPETLLSLKKVIDLLREQGLFDFQNYPQSFVTLAKLCKDIPRDPQIVYGILETLLEQLPQFLPRLNSFGITVIFYTLARLSYDKNQAVLNELLNQAGRIAEAHNERHIANILWAASILECTDHPAIDLFLPVVRRYIERKSLTDEAIDQVYRFHLASQRLPQICELLEERKFTARTIRTSPMQQRIQKLVVAILSDQPIYTVEGGKMLDCGIELDIAITSSENPHCRVNIECDSDLHRLKRLQDAFNDRIKKTLGWSVFRYDPQTHIEDQKLESDIMKILSDAEILRRAETEEERQRDEKLKIDIAGEKEKILHVYRKVGQTLGLNKKALREFEEDILKQINNALLAITDENLSALHKKIAAGKFDTLGVAASDIVMEYWKPDITQLRKLFPECDDHYLNLFFKNLQEENCADDLMAIVLLKIMGISVHFNVLVGEDGKIVPRPYPQEFESKLTAEILDSLFQEERFEVNESGVIDKSPTASKLPPVFFYAHRESAPNETKGKSVFEAATHGKRGAKYLDSLDKVAAVILRELISSPPDTQNEEYMLRIPMLSENESVLAVIIDYRNKSLHLILTDPSRRSPKLGFQPIIPIASDIEE